MTDTEFNAVVHFILRPIRKHVPDPAYRETFERLSRALNMPFTRMDYAEMLRRAMVAMFDPAGLSTPVHISELRPDVPKLRERKSKAIEHLKQMLLPPPPAPKRFTFSDDELEGAIAVATKPTKRRKAKKAERSRKAR
jgi:hypothetical protein